MAKNKEKKVKKNKADKVTKQSNKVDSKPKAATKAPAKTTEKVNIFSHLGLDAKHRAVPFQLARHYDEVTVVKNKTQFPYYVEVITDSTFVAMVVNKGDVSFWSRTGARFQFCDVLEDMLRKAKKDGVYMAQIYVPTDVMTLVNFNKLFSPFRSNKLTAPQQVIMDDKAMVLVDDFITIEEFTTGKSEAPYSKRKEVLAKSLKKVTKGKDSRFNTVHGKKCDTIEEVLSQLDNVLTNTDFTGITIRGEDNPYVCGHQNFHYMQMQAPVTFKLKCIGFQEGKGTTEGQVAKLIFNYKDGKELAVPLGSSYSKEDATKMLETLKADGKGKKKKAKKGKKVKTASSPLGYVWEVNAVEVSSAGVMKAPTVGNFTKDKADY